MNTRPRRRYRMTARAEAAEATRGRVVGAARALFLARPYEQVSLEEVARDAGVTVQTVLRRFGSKEALVAEAARRAMEEVRAQRDLAPVGEPAGAVRNLVAHYEAWGDAVLRLLAQEERVPALRRVAEGGRRLHRRWVERTFGPWLAGPGAGVARRRAQLLAVTDLLVWKLLRRDQRLSPRATERVLTELVQRLLGDT